MTETTAQYRAGWQDAKALLVFTIMLTEKAEDILSTTQIIKIINASNPPRHTR